MPIVITLTCENAVAAAEAVEGLQPAVAHIEFAFGYWCPPGAFCAASLPNTGYVVFHRKGRLPDLLVGVTADETGKVRATEPTPLPLPLPRRPDGSCPLRGLHQPLRHSGQPGSPRVRQFARAIGDIG